MCSFVVLSVAIGAMAAEQRVDAQQFSRLMKGLHSVFEDVAFNYEGDAKFVGPQRLVKGSPERIGGFHQGTYAYRADAAILVDYYKRGFRLDGLFFHNTHVLFKGDLMIANRVPDARKFGVTTVSGIPGSLNMPSSPQRILYCWYFQHLENLQARGYEYQGWETVDGHRCLRVQVDEVADSQGPDRPRVRLWIDVTRGGHPLKVEFLNGTNVRIRVQRIRLTQMAKVDGGLAWFPLGGEACSYSWNGEYHSKPVVKEVYEIMPGSVRINQGLPDSLFSVEWSGELPESSGLRAMRREFEERPPRPRVRTDPEGVQERLDTLLAEADRQSVRLDASRAVREDRGNTLILQFSLLATGIALFGLGVWRWRAA